MGFNWGGLVSTATGGLYSPGSKGPKMPKVPKPGVEKKRTVGKTAQAGGGQIRFNTEETYIDNGSKPAGPKGIINPQFKKPPQQNAKQQKMKNFYTDLQAKVNGALGGGEEGMRSEAAQRMLK